MSGEAEYFNAAISDADKVQALLEFFAWCASEGNQAGGVAGKNSAVLRSHHVNLQIGVAGIVAACKTRIDRGCMVASRRRELQKQYDMILEAAGAAALVSRQWSPPPPIAVENNKNMTIRRIYNKSTHFFEMSVLFKTDELQHLY